MLKQPRIPAVLVLSFLALVGLASETTASKQKWYEGGTLHSATALNWQKAANANKLATCADFVAMAWQKKMLKPKIQASFGTIDDFRPYAKELMAYLNAATKPDPDPGKNKRLFAKLDVAELAAVGMLHMGWTK